MLVHASAYARVFMHMHAYACICMQMHADACRCMQMHADVCLCMHMHATAAVDGETCACMYPSPYGKRSTAWGFYRLPWTGCGAAIPWGPHAATRSPFSVSAENPSSAGTAGCALRLRLTWSSVPVAELTTTGYGNGCSQIVMTTNSRPESGGCARACSMTARQSIASKKP